MDTNANFDKPCRAKSMLYFTHIPTGGCGWLDTVLLIKPGFMDAMVTVAWTGEAVIAASVMVGIGKVAKMQRRI